MPRKRRHPKVRHAPAGLRDISRTEQTWWMAYGPMLRSDVDHDDAGAISHLYTVWPDLPTFLRFYASVREQWCAERPHLRERSAVERLYMAWQRGEDLDQGSSRHRRRTSRRRSEFALVQ